MVLKKTFVAAALGAVLSTVISAPSALAQTENRDECVDLPQSKLLAQEERPLDSSGAESLKRFVEGDQVKLHTAQENLDWENAHTIDLDVEHSAVNIPIKNVGIELSNLTIALDSHKNPIAYAETHLFEQSAESGRLVSWENGVAKTDQTFNASSIVPMRGIGEMVSRLSNCLSSHGIAPWIVTAATAVCSFGSIPGLAACLTAIGVGGGTVGWCAGYAIRGTGNEYE